MDTQRGARRRPQHAEVAITGALLCACYTGPDGAQEVTGTLTQAGSADASQGTSAGETSSGGDPSGGGTTTGGPTTDGLDTTSALTDAAGTTDALTGGVVTTGGDATTEPSGTTTGPDATTTGGDTGDGVCTDGSPGADTGQPDNHDDAAQVCARWANDLADSAYGPWCGDVASCDAGDVAAAGRTNTLRALNLYRWLADLPPVTNDPTRDAKAQECALMMHANGQLSHSPPQSWDCYSSDGASAAGSSNIASTSGFAAVGLYMQDPGNPQTIGHRRWILSNSLGPVGLGSTSSYSCMWVIGGNGNAGKPWTAWPPPGLVPHAAVAALNSTGWTVQSDGVGLNNAVVSVTENGEDRPVQVNQLLGGYGSSAAISFIPMGWSAQPDTTYSVSITGINQPIAYDVQVISCP
ncbi:MAG: CAP domain-containing protein [Myxococcales bacterium]|nr:CAP domain-containing protein [Myxococcales bacterium]